MRDFTDRTFILRVDATDIGSTEATLASDIAFLTEHQVRPIVVAPNARIAASWVHTLNRNANVAVGLSGSDAALLPATGPTEAAHVGTVQTRLLATLTTAGYVPIIEPTAFGLSGNDVAVAPDEVACAIASATDAVRIIFFHTAGGVIDPQTRCLLNELTPAETLLLADQVDCIDPSLRMTMRAAALGVRSGVEAAQIIDGRIAHATIIEVLTAQHLGTQVTGSILISG
jgi:acetylglutamate kinase